MPTAIRSHLHRVISVFSCRLTPSGAVRLLPLSSQVQRALFSATLPPAVEDLAATVLRDPVKVVIGTVNAGATTIDQKLVFVGRYEVITLQIPVITLLTCRYHL